MHPAMILSLPLLLSTGTNKCFNLPSSMANFDVTPQFTKVQIITENWISVINEIPLFASNNICGT